MARSVVGDTLDGSAIEWFTDNPFVATVTQEGLIEGKGDGWVFIRAVAGGKSDTATVRVRSAGPLQFATINLGGLSAAGHTCGVASNGEIYCWGLNESGQLGLGDAISGGTPFPVRSELEFTSLGSGGEHTCALALGGDVYCWGRNSYGQLGDRSGTSSTVPVRVAGEGDFATVRAGGDHTCGLKADGTAFCWGRNDLGQLGNGSKDNRTTPTAVYGDHVFQTLDAGGLHTCGVTTDFVGYCWGDNSSGQLGDGTNLQSDTAVAVVAVDAVQFGRVTAGGEHSCAIAPDNVAYCRGANSFGQLADYSTDPSNVPVRVGGGFLYDEIDSGPTHTCADVAFSEVLMCWGHNQVGELGNGTMTNSNYPVRVDGT
ncbi:MAG: hypothetical protein JSV86_13650 [Gemmatimonadota bacterium]|nr:MAG: hypothetical protein JSV86_13650 [Gemmatimonadota bacterium]